MSAWCWRPWRWPTRPSCLPRSGSTVEKLGKGFFAVRIHYGFFESPDIPEALAGARAHGLALDMDTTTFFLGRETLVPGDHPSLSRWRVALYMWLASNALSPARFYQFAAEPGGRTGHPDRDLIEQA